MLILYKDMRDGSIMENVSGVCEPGNLHYLPHRPVFREIKKLKKENSI